MTLITVTRRDGSTTQVDSNEQRLVHGVDAEGAYLGLVPEGQPAGVMDHPPPPMRSANWRAAGGRWQYVRPLAEAKAEAWARVKLSRDLAEYGGFAWDGSRFDSDAPSQARIQGAVLLATTRPGRFPVPWTLADNAVRSLSAAETVELGAALAAHVAAQHATARTLRAQIAAAASIAEADGVQWPGA